MTTPAAYEHGGYTFKRAETPREFEQIERLNHDTFAAELGQHTETEDGRLVDRLHEQNTYFVALEGDAVVGMITMHDAPPFSVVKRLPDASILDRYEGRRLEIRLLAIRRSHRNQMLFAGLLWMVFQHARSYDWLIISGVEQRIELYRSLGFRELGPPVPDGRASYTPMIMRVADMPEHVIQSAARWASRAGLNASSD